jgi:hypothetical protein
MYDKHHYIIGSLATARSEPTREPTLRIQAHPGLVAFFEFWNIEVNGIALNGYGHFKKYPTGWGPCRQYDDRPESDWRFLSAHRTGTFSGEPTEAGKRKIREWAKSQCLPWCEAHPDEFTRVDLRNQLGALRTAREHLEKLRAELTAGEKQLEGLSHVFGQELLKHQPSLWPEKWEDFA